MTTETTSHTKQQDKQDQPSTEPVAPLHHRLILLFLGSGLIVATFLVFIPKDKEYFPTDENQYKTNLAYIAYEGVAHDLTINNATNLI